MRKGRHTGYQLGVGDLAPGILFGTADINQDDILQGMKRGRPISLATLSIMPHTMIIIQPEPYKETIS